MFPQPLLADRPQAVQLVLAVAVPALFGVVCGVMLVVSEAAYIVLSVLAILGGVGAGFDHRGAGEGAVRGVVGGVLFGTLILVTRELSGKDALVDLPDPPVLLAVATGILGTLFGAIGGALRERVERRAIA